MSETMPLTANKVDETFLFDGARLRVVLSGEATGGKISILYAAMPPGAGSAPHFHSREEETPFVLEGTLQIETQGRTIAVPEGAAMNLPRDIPHRLSNTSQRDTRVLLICTPAGFDDFVSRVGQRMSGTVTPREPLTPDALRKIVEISREYGISIVDDAAL
jgi:uncharacterized cupin superfamily protein